jgi:hypothetical protein
MISRRSFIGGFALFIAIARYTTPVFAAAPRIVIHKDPNCGCCTAWADHLRANGFLITVLDTPAINQVKKRLGLPMQLASCHTAEIGGYVIEGHVPAAAIHKLMASRASIRGLAVPGMPVGSPGMEVEGQPAQTYDVIAFGPGGQSVFARYEGAKELPIN